MNSLGLSDFARYLEDSILTKIHVSLVGKVTEYNKGLVSVEPLIWPSDMVDQKLKGCLLHNLLFCFPGSEDCSVTFPVVPRKTLVLVLFNDFSMEEFLLKKKIEEVIVTKSVQRHLAESGRGIAIPLFGYFDFLKTESGSEESVLEPLDSNPKKMEIRSERDLTIRSGKKLELQSSQELEVIAKKGMKLTNGKAELCDIIQRLIAAVSAIVVTQGVGPDAGVLNRLTDELTELMRGSSQESN